MCPFLKIKVIFYNKAGHKKTTQEKSQTKRDSKAMMAIQYSLSKYSSTLGLILQCH